MNQPPCSQRHFFSSTGSHHSEAVLTEDDPTKHPAAANTQWNQVVAVHVENMQPAPQVGGTTLGTYIRHAVRKNSTVPPSPYSARSAGTSLTDNLDDDDRLARIRAFLLREGHTAGWRGPSEDRVLPPFPRYSTSGVDRIGK